MKKFYITFLIVIILAGNSFAQSGLEPDTIFVSPGWNLIGSHFTGAVSDIVITEPPGILASPFYRFTSGNGYLAADTLEESLGYWVKISNPQNRPGFTFIVIYPPSTGWTCGHGIWGRVWHGEKYHRTVQIGSQCWLKSNLNIGTMIDGSIDQTNNGIVEKYCYGNDASNCDAYGGLYKWREAMQYEWERGSQGICPNGWHIPTSSDFFILYGYVSANGNALKSVGEGAGYGAGTNTSGFSALLAGQKSYSTFMEKGSSANFWMSESWPGETAEYLNLWGGDHTIDFDFAEWNFYAFSVRCIKN